VSAPCFSSTPMASWCSSTKAVAGKGVGEKATEPDVRTHGLQKLSTRAVAPPTEPCAFPGLPEKEGC
jgi:hypothetical protein